MDHSHHDHSAHMMDHGGMDHGGHGGGDMAPMCNMNVRISLPLPRLSPHSYNLAFD